MRFRKQEGVWMKGSCSHTHGPQPSTGSAEAGRGGTQRLEESGLCTLQARAEAG